MSWFLSSTALVEACGERRYFYGRWDRFFAWWEARPQGPPRPVVPRWPLLNHRGDLAMTWPGPAEAVDARDLESVFSGEECERFYLHLEGEGDDERPDATPAESALDPWRDYVALIPRQIRTSAGAFDSDQWLALEAMASVPALVSTFAQAKNRQFARLCFMLARAAAATRSERQALYDAIVHEKRLSLLGRLTGRPLTRAEGNLLLRLSPDALPPGAVEQLLQAATDPTVGRSLAHLPVIGRQQLAALRLLPPALCAPGLLEAVEVCGAAELLGDCLSDLQLLPEGEPRRRVLANLAGSASRVRPGSSIDLLADRWTRRIADALVLPPPPFLGDRMLRPLCSAGEIRRQGFLLRNCLVDGFDLRAVVEGSAYYYAWSAEEPATIALFRDENGWTIAEMTGMDNCALSDGTERSILLAFGGAVRAQVPRPQG